MPKGRDETDTLRHFMLLALYLQAKDMTISLTNLSTIKNYENLYGPIIAKYVNRDAKLN